ncbi:hypothetical protein GTS_48580 [Gandjariella thermophila]|uniref:Uncharacterized protein n=1 Tax=Gandjariella thermophila TaxID=1931992 RepID=A0A4D4J8S5_9PSEU|nr:hypothetical protein GTS_48580 [Gandjariella thermophila]
MADYWADPAQWFLPRGLTSAADYLHELAVMAVLAGWLLRWQPGTMHAAILRGATAEQVAEAAGTTVAEVYERWSHWVAGQVRLFHTSAPLPNGTRLGVAPEEAQRVRQAFQRALPEPATQPLSVVIDEVTLTPAQWKAVARKVQAYITGGAGYDLTAARATAYDQGWHDALMSFAAWAAAQADDAAPGQSR